MFNHQGVHRGTAFKLGAVVGVQMVIIRVHGDHPTSMEDDPSVEESMSKWWFNGDLMMINDG